jgi:zona occludens toxin (predicted ATPase)
MPMVACELIVAFWRTLMLPSAVFRSDCSVEISVSRADPEAADAAAMASSESPARKAKGTELSNSPSTIGV